MSNATDHKSPASTAKATKKIEEISPWRMLILLPAVVLLRLLTASLRWQIDAHSQQTLQSGGPATFIAGWHNRLVATEPVFRKYRKNRRIRALVSASKDGAWLVAFFRLVHVEAIRGSSSFRASQAIRDIIGCLNQGSDVAITPDGPRGPKHKVKPGLGQLAAKKEVPIILIGAAYQRKWILNSWDSFEIPKPFSSVVVRAEWVAPQQLLALSDEEKNVHIENKLMALETMAANALSI